VVKRALAVVWGAAILLLVTIREPEPVRLKLAAVIAAIGVAFGLWKSAAQDSRERAENLAAHRRANNLCLRCGYNLAGNLSGTCPECGRKVG
jgi:hypothetical protein